MLWWIVGLLALIWLALMRVCWLLRPVSAYYARKADSLVREKFADDERFADHY